MKLKIGIAGASGYVAQELVRILTRHPMVEEIKLFSSSLAGKEYSASYLNYTGVTKGILTDIITDKKTENLSLLCRDLSELSQEREGLDLIFFALPHGESLKWIDEDLLSRVKVIDMGGGFRFKERETYERWYQESGAKEELLAEAVYGLSEIRREEIRNARLIANPGCYPTCSLLPLIPLLSKNRLKVESLIIDGKSGVSGAGRKSGLNTHFCETHNSFKAYGVANHRHTPEIEQAVSQTVDREVRLNFTPHLVPMERGILITTYVDVVEGVTESELKETLTAYYAEEPFVQLLWHSENSPWPETRWVLGSNQCHINLRLDPRTGRLILVSAIDNLVKGAAGQGVQNMNLLFGIEESLGLSQIPLFP